MRLGIAFLALLGLAAAQADAVVLYKHVDAQGRVSYFDRPVRPAEGGRVEALEIDTSVNATRSAPAVAPETENERIIRRRAPEPDLRSLDAARERLQSARAALEAAQASSTPEDWIYLGNRHRAPRPEYLARLESLESDVRAAEAQVAEQERRARLQ